MQCKYCGKELAEGSAFCPHCGHPQKETAGQVAVETPSAPAPQPAAEGALKCPHCGSTRLQFTTTVKTQGVSVSDACCGYICLGPLGLLCGLCGAGATETKEGWVCCDCGTKFTTGEAQRAVRQKLQQEQNLAKKQQEKEAQLATWHSMMDSCPYPPEHLATLYEETVKQEEDKDKQLRTARGEERKAIGSWQAAAYGMDVGLLLLLIGAIVFLPGPPLRCRMRLLLLLIGAIVFLFALFTGGAVGYGLLCAALGIVIFVLFSNRDDKLFDQYASPALKAMKQEKEQASQHKAELKKYQEAYQGLKADAAAGEKKNA